MLIDDITIRVIAGKGGDGLATFSGTRLTLGPTGGSGGNGGDVYCEGVSDLSALTRLRNQKVFRAEDGARGRRQLNDGPAGEDLVILVPVGTIIHNLDTGNDRDIVKTGERVLLARGGWGGKGNFLFRSSTNTSPREFEYGTRGQEFTVRLELKMIADVGLVGLPNAGKSSLLNELTNAKSKVANYHFTTLEPNLGVHYDLILADIPGLIEGASEGKGLGIKFLRHIERTGILFHLISAESKHPAADYHTIRNELGAYNAALLDKKEFLFLSKTDMVNPTETKKKLTALKKLNKTAAPLSIHDPDAVAKVQKILNTIAKKKAIKTE